MEREARFTLGGCELVGTIAVPGDDGPSPCVLLVPGSGQVDRDENHRKLRLNAFHGMARYLARSGIASFRCDKRGVGQSGGDYWATGFHDRVDDARAAVQFLKRHPGIRPGMIVVLGHSEGAFIATRLAGDGTDLAGVIRVAGAAHSGEAVLR